MGAGVYARAERKGAIHRSGWRRPGCSPARPAAMLMPGKPRVKLMNHRPGDGDHDADQRRSAALIGLIIILALAIAGVWLVRELREKSALEDCLMSGRTNCAPIETPSH